MGSVPSFLRAGFFGTCVQPPPNEREGPRRPLPEYNAVAPMPTEIPEGGYLKYPVTIQQEQHAMLLIRRVQDGTPVEEALKIEDLLRKPPNRPPKGERLSIFYSDFEPDDVMAMTQLQQWKKEQKILDEVVHICYCDFVTKDYGTVYEKKMLVAGLLLGETSLLTLCAEGMEGTEQPEDAAQHVHRKATEIAVQRRPEVIGKICDRLQNFTGRLVELYILAPLKGNLNAIVTELKKRRVWPLKRADGTIMQWKVSLYSGSYNIKGYTRDDMATLKEIYAYCGEPIVDMAKFTFFGGENCHKISDSMGYWAMPDFAGRLHKTNSVLTSVLSLLNEEFNLGLIHPKNKALFKGSELTADERKRVEALNETLTKYNSHEFAKALRNDSGLWAKVAGYKKSTVAAFANKAADGPLCDQLVFLHEYAEAHARNCVQVVEGRWQVDNAKGFSRVVAGEPQGQGDIMARQSVLKDPQDEKALQLLRLASEEYIFAWMDGLQK